MAQEKGNEALNCNDGLGWRGCSITEVELMGFITDHLSSRRRRQSSRWLEDFQIMKSKSGQSIKKIGQ